MAIVVDRGAVHIGSLFEQYATKSSLKPLNERAELVRYFFEHAQAEWNGPKPLTPARIGMKLAHLSKQDLYAFKSILEDRVRAGKGPWSKMFWGMLKVRS